MKSNSTGASKVKDGKTTYGENDLKVVYVVFFGLDELVNDLLALEFHLRKCLERIAL